MRYRFAQSDWAVCLAVVLQSVGFAEALYCLEPVVYEEPDHYRVECPSFGDASSTCVVTSLPDAGGVFRFNCTVHARSFCDTRLGEWAWSVPCTHVCSTYNLPERYDSRYDLTCTENGPADPPGFPAMKIECSPAAKSPDGTCTGLATCNRGAWESSIACHQSVGLTPGTCSGTYAPGPSALPLPGHIGADCSQATQPGQECALILNAAGRHCTGAVTCTDSGGYDSTVRCHCLTASLRQQNPRVRLHCSHPNPASAILQAWMTSSQIRDVQAEQAFVMEGGTCTFLQAAGCRGAPVPTCVDGMWQNATKIYCGDYREVVCSGTYTVPPALASLVAVDCTGATREGDTCTLITDKLCSGAPVCRADGKYTTDLACYCDGTAALAKYPRHNLDCPAGVTTDVGGTTGVQPGAKCTYTGPLAVRCTPEVITCEPATLTFTDSLCGDTAQGCPEGSPIFNLQVYDDMVLICTGATRPGDLCRYYFHDGTGARRAKQPFCTGEVSCAPWMAIYRLESTLECRCWREDLSETNQGLDFFGPAGPPCADVVAVGQKCPWTIDAASDTPTPCRDANLFPTCGADLRWSPLAIACDGSASQCTGVLPAGRNPYAAQGLSVDCTGVRKDGEKCRLSWPTKQVAYLPDPRGRESLLSSTLTSSDSYAQAVRAHEHPERIVPHCTGTVQCTAGAGGYSSDLQCGCAAGVLKQVNPRVTTWAGTCGVSTVGGAVCGFDAAALVAPFNEPACTPPTCAAESLTFSSYNLRCFPSLKCVGLDVSGSKPTKACEALGETCTPADMSTVAPLCDGLVMCTGGGYWSNHTCPQSGTAVTNVSRPTNKECVVDRCHDAACTVKYTTVLEGWVCRVNGRFVSLGVCNSTGTCVPFVDLDTDCSSTVCRGNILDVRSPSPSPADEYCVDYDGRRNGKAAICTKRPNPQNGCSVDDVLRCMHVDRGMQPVCRSDGTPRVPTCEADRCPAFVAVSCARVPSKAACTYHAAQTQTAHSVPRGYADNGCLLEACFITPSGESIVSNETGKCEGKIFPCSSDGDLDCLSQGRVSGEPLACVATPGSAHTCQAVECGTPFCHAIPPGCGYVKEAEFAAPPASGGPTAPSQASYVSAKECPRQPCGRIVCDSDCGLRDVVLCAAQLPRKRCVVLDGTATCVPHPCPPVSCTPPAGCSFTALPSTLRRFDPFGCPIAPCGELRCTDFAACEPADVERCRTAEGGKGCFVDPVAKAPRCGDRECGREGREACLPTPGCVYHASAELDADGCLRFPCGREVCEGVHVCSLVLCDAGEGEVCRTDANGAPRCVADPSLGAAAPSPKCTPYVDCTTAAEGCESDVTNPLDPRVACKLRKAVKPVVAPPATCADYICPGGTTCVTAAGGAQFSPTVACRGPNDAVYTTEQLGGPDAVVRAAGGEEGTVVFPVGDSCAKKVGEAADPCAVRPAPCAGGERCVAVRQTALTPGEAAPACAPLVATCVAAGDCFPACADLAAKQSLQALPCVALTCVEGVCQVRRLPDEAACDTSGAGGAGVCRAGDCVAQAALCLPGSCGDDAAARTPCHSRRCSEEESCAVDLWEGWGCGDNGTRVCDDAGQCHEPDVRPLWNPQVADDCYAGGGCPVGHVCFDADATANGLRRCSCPPGTRARTGGVCDAVGVVPGIAGKVAENPALVCGVGETGECSQKFRACTVEPGTGRQTCETGPRCPLPPAFCPHTDPVLRCLLNNEVVGAGAGVGATTSALFGNVGRTDLSGECPLFPCDDDAAKRTSTLDPGPGVAAAPSCGSCIPAVLASCAARPWAAGDPSRRMVCAASGSGTQTCRPLSCPKPYCTPLPAGCVYVALPTPAAGYCPTEPCGRVQCSDTLSACPRAKVLECSVLAPRQRCAYVDGAPTCLPYPCSPASCHTLPGCRYVAEEAAVVVRDETGCPVYPCGRLDCSVLESELTACTADAAEACTRAGSRCAVVLAGGHLTAGSCMPRLCPAADHRACTRTPGCTYAADTALDARGCPLYPCGRETCSAVLVCAGVCAGAAGCRAVHGVATCVGVATETCERVSCPGGTFCVAPVSAGQKPVCVAASEVACFDAGTGKSRCTGDETCSAEEGGCVAQPATPCDADACACAGRPCSPQERCEVTKGKAADDAAVTSCVLRVVPTDLCARVVCPRDETCAVGRGVAACVARTPRCVCPEGSQCAADGKSCRYAATHFLSPIPPPPSPLQGTPQAPPEYSDSTQLPSTPPSPPIPILPHRKPECTPSCSGARDVCVFVSGVATCLTHDLCADWEWPPPTGLCSTSADCPAGTVCPAPGGDATVGRVSRWCACNPETGGPAACSDAVMPDTRRCVPAAWGCNATGAGAAERRWCCSVLQTLCGDGGGSSSGALAYHCKPVGGEGPERWGAEKRAKCCSETGIGCELSGSGGAASFDCSSEERWTAAKRAWCCAERGLACPAEETPCVAAETGPNATAAADAPEARRAFCCSVRGVCGALAPDTPAGGPSGRKDDQEPFDCKSGEVFVSERQAYCCTRYGVQCARSKPRYDCWGAVPPGLSGDDMASRKRFCCATHSVGCRPYAGGTPPYACVAGAGAAGATAEQRAWCCAQRGTLCAAEATVDDACAPGRTAAMSDVERDGCCRSRNVYCRFACPEAGTLEGDQAQGWAQPRKEFCCRLKGVGCVVRRGSLPTDGDDSALEGVATFGVRVWTQFELSYHGDWTRVERDPKGYAERLLYTLQRVVSARGKGGDKAARVLLQVVGPLPASASDGGVVAPPGAATAAGSQAIVVPKEWHDAWNASASAAAATTGAADAAVLRVRGAAVLGAEHAVDLAHLQAGGGTGIYTRFTIDAVDTSAAAAAHERLAAETAAASKGEGLLATNDGGRAYIIVPIAPLEATGLSYGVKAESSSGAGTAAWMIVGGVLGVLVLVGAAGYMVSLRAGSRPPAFSTPSADGSYFCESGWYEKELVSLGYTAGGGGSNSNSETHIVESGSI